MACIWTIAIILKNAITSMRTARSIMMWIVLKSTRTVPIMEIAGAAAVEFK
jgi:hypothetical protein